MIEIVAASPKSEHQFYAAAPLGISLRRLAADKRIAGRICFGNTGAKKDGLPAIFNRQIAAAGREAIIVFTHDDVWLDDCFLADRLVEALKRFDVVGVAGNRRILPHQPAWAFVDEKFTWDEPKHLSGALAHGANAGGAISHFGPTPARCELLDGVFLAVKASVLAKHTLRFNERLRFHFYDMDFCREAKRRGLRLGTWPIAITHASGGAFGSAQWSKERRVYFKKWKS
jgi:GT2 family glycosyltransferase